MRSKKQSPRGKRKAVVVKRKTKRKSPPKRKPQSPAQIVHERTHLDDGPPLADDTAKTIFENPQLGGATIVEEYDEGENR